MAFLEGMTTESSLDFDEMEARRLWRQVCGERWVLWKQSVERGTCQCLREKTQHAKFCIKVSEKQTENIALTSCG